MNLKFPRWLVICSNASFRLQFAAFVLLWIASPVQAAGGQNLPPWEVVAEYVDRHFANITDYEVGDIISMSNVRPLIEGLDRIGWAVPARKFILENVPKDTDYVVKQLRTEPGMKFMRQISKYPECYDRLYHLAAIPRGRQQVYDLIRAKDGYQMIEYMTTTQQGKNLGTQLSHSPHGANFNKPTGLIYTAEDLKAALEKSYGDTVKALQTVK